MVTKSQKIRLGIFISLAFLALVVTLIIIVAPKLFQIRDAYYIGFSDASLTGLQEGSSVKYHGLTVGYVSDISIDPHDIRRVIVKISLEPDTPIRTDTKAEITFLGITGMKVVELKGGSPEAEPLEPGSFIEPGRSITEEITGRAEIIAEKTEVILNNLASLTDEENRERFTALADNASKAIEELYDLLHKNNKAVTTTISNTQEFSMDMKEVTQSAKISLENIKNYTESDSLNQILGNLVEITNSLKEAELVMLIQEMNVALESLNKMLADIEMSFSKTRTDLVYTIETMKETSDYLNQFSRMISEDPSILVRGAEPANAPDANLEN